MKAVLKVHNINNQSDVSKIQRAITSNEGIIACEISIQKKEIQIIYNDTWLNIDKVIECIENLGYMIL
ncbi:heavy-metal-associated domain-containing protein [Clostridium sp. SHJSY1]|uniref:heavy-metal-associated domain-containing protein n=1 Tax=Clostridium sp. SHJSY1 TaxID=2942483 RepID=UPI002875C9E0|nr:heavy-metal-associated domain-containing protein [Clostridium sp. SHJSY1]MDS0526837.1 heavy-metal-associated domain-containing protein [Clostridium sp. SHJSY1]